MADHPITREPASEPSAARASLPASRWPGPTRHAALGLWLVARFPGTVGLAWALLYFDPPAGPMLPVVSFAVALASLHGALYALRRAGRGRVRIAGQDLVVDAWDRETALPLDAISRLHPWRVAVPEAGLRVRTRDGGRLDLGLEDPTHLLRGLAEAGSPELRALALQAQARAAVADARAAAARAAQRRLPLSARTALRVAIWSLIPACAFFYTHQSIAFGGFWGEYLMVGPLAWLRTFVRLWITCAAIAYVYSSLCRGVAALCRWCATRVAPSHAARARRVAGGLDALAYYAGVPALTALRYLG